MEYIIFIHAKKDVITEKNDAMKNSKEKRKLSAKKWRSGEDLMNLFIDLKNLTCKKILKNTRESITYEDHLVAFSCLYT